MNRFLGWVAWLGTLRKQVFPPHLVLLVLCLTGFTWGLGNLLETRQNKGQVHTLSQLELLDHGAPQNYVELTGTVLADGWLKGMEDTVYLPFFDEEAQIITYVRWPKSSPIPQAGVTYKLKGRLSFVDAATEKQIPPDAGKIRFNRNQYLNYGQQPVSIYWALMAMLLSLVCSWPLLLTWFSHYLVFQASPVEVFQASPTENKPEPDSGSGTIRASARFFQDKKRKLRFLETPVTLTENNQQWTLKNSEGWFVTFEHISDLTTGKLFLGSKTYPALRFNASELTRKYHQSVVLTFDSPAQLQLTLKKLTTSSTTP